MGEPGGVGTRAGRRGRRVPWGLAGMVGLVVWLETGVARRGVDLLDVDDWAYRQSSRAASSAGQAGGAGVLCFGDSLIKFGVVPKGVEEGSGLRAWNLAVSGGQAPASYLLLERALDSGARPAAVVVGFAPRLLALGPQHNLARWAGVAGPVGAARLAWSARDPGLFAAVVLRRLLPSALAREGIRDQVVSALGGRVDSHRWANLLASRNWSRNAGAQLVPAAAGGSLGALSDQDVEAYRKGYYPAWSCDPANDRAVGRFLALAASRGVAVYWVLPPVLPALQTRLTAVGFDAAHEAYVRSWQSRYPGLTVLDGRGRVADPSAFHDPNHLAACGAYAFSLALGAALRGDHSTPVGGRWVRLPECRPCPLPEGVEDLDGSRLALGSRAGAARR